MYLYFYKNIEIQLFTYLTKLIITFTVVHNPLQAALSSGPVQS